MAARGDFGYGAISEFHDDPSMPSRPIGSRDAASGLPAPFAELSEQVGADIFAIGNHSHSLDRVASQISEDADIPAIKAEIGGRFEENLNERLEEVLIRDVEAVDF